MIWLNEEQVIFLHDDVVVKSGGRSGLRDERLLSSAIYSPLQTYGGVELFPSTIEKIARITAGLTKNHPFLDGNKRIGAHAMLVLLNLNGIKIGYTQKELSDLFLSLAAGESSYEDIKEWITLRIKD